MAIFLKRNGSWQEIEEPYIKRNGDWILPEEGYIKENGEWKLIFEQFEFEVETVSASEQINEATFTGQLTAFEDFEESNFFQTSLSDANSSPAAAVDGDSQKVAVGGGGGDVYIYDRDFSQTNVLSNPSDRVLSCSYNASTGRLAVGSADNNVYVYGSDGNLEQALNDPTDEVNEVEINENTGEIAAGSKDENVYVYDSGLSLSDTVSQPSNPVKSLAWRESDGYLFVSSNPGEVTVFDGSLSVATSLSDATGNTRVSVDEANGRVAVLDSSDIYIYTNNFSLTDQLAQFDETASGKLGDIAWDDTGRIAHASRDSNLYIYNSSYQNIATLEDSSRRFSEMDWGTNEVIAAGADQGGQGDCYIFSTGVAAFFEYGKQGSGLQNRVRAGGRTALGQFTTTVDGLQPLTSYEVRAGGETAESRESFGDTILFTTSDTILEVDTLQPSNVFTSTADLRGEIKGFAGFNQDADVFFEWGEQTSGTVNTLQAGTQSGTGFFEKQVTGLKDGTSYVYQAVAEAEGRRESGPEVTFSTTAIQLSVSTLGATGVQSQSATLNGELTEYSGFTQDATVEFEWGEQGQGFPNTSTADQSPVGQTQQFSTEVDVDPSVSYEYRARAEAEGVSDTGGFVTFTTQDTTLQVQTDQASSVTFDSATLNGELTAFSGFAQNEEADVEFEWGEAGKGMGNIADAGTRSSTGSFNAQVSGLNNDTKYEYRAVASAGTKTRKGSTLEFTTDDVQISVETLQADQVGKTGARINGELTQLAGTNSTDVNFAWGETGNGTPNTTPKQSRNSTGTFDENLTGLKQNTDYEFKAKAGSEEGSLKTFTTSEFVISIDNANWSFGGGDGKTFGQDISVDVQVSGTGGNNYDYTVREFIEGNDQGVVVSASGVSGQSFTANWSIGDSGASESDFNQDDAVSYEVTVTDQNGNSDTAGSPGILYQEAPSISVPNTKSFFAQQGDQQTRSVDIEEDSGFEDLSVNGASITGGDSEEFSFSNLPSTVTAGGKETLDVTYSPSQVETDNATLEIQHDGRNTPSPVGISLEGNAQQVPRIEVSPDNYDFGETPIGNAPTKDFTVEEDGGDSDLTINSTDISGDAEFNITQDISDGTTIPANGSETMTVEYTPQTAGTTNTATLTINSDADNEPTFDVPLEGKAKAVPSIDVDPEGQQDLGTIPADESASQQYTISENSSEQQVNTSVGFAQNPSDWSIQGAPSSVSAGGSESFKVTFDPSTSGQQNVTLEIQHDATNTSSPVTRDLTAEATQESTISVNPSDGGTLDFGSIIEDETSGGSVTISETGGSNGFNVSSFSVSGNAFNITSSTPSSISASGSETVNIEFDPPSEGNYNESFTFSHDAAAGDSDQSVTITFSGTAESVSTISTTPSDGGTLTLSATAGNSDSDTITVSEVGGGEGFDVTSWNLNENSSSGSEFNVSNSPGSSFSVSAASAKDFTIEYQPNDDTDDSGTFEISHNAADGPSSPITIDISGSSSAPATFYIGTTSKGFGNALVNNQNKTETIGLGESGGDNGYNINNQSITSNSNDFSVTNSASSSIGPNDSDNVTFEFAPQGNVSGSSEQRTGNFRIEHDAPAGNSSPVDVSLTGTALKRATASVSKQSIDFGQVTVGDSDTEYFQISEETGNESYNVNNVGFSNSTNEFSASSISNVSSGGTSDGNVTFSPNDQGSEQNTLEINHDATNGDDPLTISLSGEGTQQVTASSQSQDVSFGTVSQNSGTKSDSFSISETSGNGSYNVTGDNLTNNTQEYSLSNVPSSVGSGSSQNVNVALDTGTGDTGQINSTAEIYHDAPGGPDPLTVDLTATVVAPATIDVSTESLGFSDTTVGNSTSSQSFTVSEAGGDNGFNTSNSGVRSQDYNGENQFTVTDDVAGSISAGGSDTVSIKFAPNSSGNWNATYGFDNTANEDANNSGDEGQAYVNLSGTALAQANIEGQNPPGGTTIDFSNTVKGQEESVTIDLVETGGDNGAYYGSNLSGDTNHFSRSGESGSVSPGGTDTVTLTFEPSGTGQFSATMEFNWQTNDSNASGTVSYTLTGTGKPKPSLSITPDPLDFGKVETSTTAQKSLTFEETSGSDSISVYNIDDIANQNFSFVNSGDKNFTLGAGSSRQVEIEFDPDDTDSYLSTYEATYNSSSLNSSQDTDLQAVQGEGENSNAPSISVTASTTSFGPVEVDATDNVDDAFIINETSGDKDLTVNDIYFDAGPLNDGSGNFTVTGTSFQSTISAGQSGEVDVKFDPKGSSGTKTAYINFDTNAQNASNVDKIIDGDTLVSYDYINWAFSSGEEFAGGQELEVTGKVLGVGPNDTWDLRIEEKIVSGSNDGLSGDVVNKNDLGTNPDGEQVFNEVWNVGDGVGQNNFGDGATIEYRVEVNENGKSYTKTRTRPISVSEGQPNDLELLNVDWDPQVNAGRQFDSGEAVVQGEVKNIRANTNDIAYQILPSGANWNSGQHIASGTFNFNKSGDMQFFGPINAEKDGNSSQYVLKINEVDSLDVNDEVSSANNYVEDVVVSGGDCTYFRDTSNNQGDISVSWSGGEANYRLSVNNTTRGTTLVSDEQVSTSDSDRNADSNDVSTIYDSSTQDGDNIEFTIRDNGGTGDYFEDSGVTQAGTFDGGDSTDGTDGSDGSDFQQKNVEASEYDPSEDTDESGDNQQNK